jgi:hypothetical protein
MRRSLRGAADPSRGVGVLLTDEEEESWVGVEEQLTLQKSYL